MGKNDQLGARDDTVTIEETTNMTFNCPGRDAQIVAGFVARGALHQEPDDLDLPRARRPNGVPGRFERHRRKRRLASGHRPDGRQDGVELGCLRQEAGAPALEDGAHQRGAVERRVGDGADAGVSGGGDHVEAIASALDLEVAQEDVRPFMGTRGHECERGLQSARLPEIDEGRAPAVSGDCSAHRGADGRVIVGHRDADPELVLRTPGVHGSHHASADALNDVGIAVALDIDRCMRNYLRHHASGGAPAAGASSAAGQCGQSGIRPVPAVTVDDITVLPRIPEPDPALVRQRQVLGVTLAPKGYEGEGFPVRRAFHGVDLADLDPFVHLDQMGEVEYAPGEPKGTPWHPHRGFETVTYMIDGVFEHSDSNGGGGVITNGDTQWMTAGAGILHIEKPPEWLVAKGGLFHGFQLWVNLPAAQKFSAPRYQDIRAAEVALATSPDGGALVRVIAGEMGGLAGPGSTYTPMTLVHATLSPGARLSLPWRPDYNALVYVMAGLGTVGVDVPGVSEATSIQTGQLGRFGPGEALTISALPMGRQEARSPNLDVLVLGGRPIREPVAWMGPFVMNTRQEVMQAMADYQAGRLGTIPAIHGAPTTIQEG
jgi:redox-sensitive bicupin YhaK (pirin superfamily)